MFRIKTAASAALAVVVLAGSAQAAFVLVDDFNRADNLTLGTSAIGNAWIKNTSSDEPADWAQILNNQVRVEYPLVAGSDQSSLVLDLDSGTTSDIGNTEVGTLFLRFQMNNTTGEPWNLSVGLSDVDAASAGGFSDFEAQVALVSGATEADAELGPRNGTNFAVSDATWYNLWIVADNSTDTADYWISTGLDGATTQIGDDLAFRNGTTDPLQSLLFVGSNATTDELLFDSIYFDNASNLVNPIPEPATIALIGLGALMLRRRR